MSEFGFIASPPKNFADDEHSERCALSGLH